MVKFMNPRANEKARAALIAGRLTPRHDAAVFDVIGLNGNYVVTIIGDRHVCNCEHGRKAATDQDKATCWHAVAAYLLLTNETPTDGGDPFAGIGDNR